MTGGSRGIGRGIVVCLARAGYDVVFSYNSKEEEAIETKQMAENAGGTCYYHQASLENPGVGQELVHTAIRELGGLDLLVNNAGITVFESILDLSWENVQRLTNLDF
ncbi:MAG: SDR family NAD(P)-dependent oxidoreductase [Hungatella hathewayi]